MVNTTITSKNPAGFAVRTLASLVEFLIIFTPTVWFASYVAGSQTMEELVLRAMQYFVLYAMPMMLLVNLVYSPMLLSHYGATLGKMITGLKVTDENGKYLSYKRSFFRQTVGYAFSSIYIALGYLAIIKDSKKQGWHDKAVGSMVWSARPLWPLALAVLAALIAANSVFISNTIDGIKNSPLKDDFAALGQALSKEDSAADPLKGSSLEEVNQRLTDDSQEALTLLNGGNVEQAYALGLKMTGEDRTQGEQAVGYAIMAQARLQQGRIDEANDLAKQGVDLAPDVAITHAIYGLTLFASGSVTEGLAELQKAAELDPENPQYSDLLNQLQQAQ